MLLSTVAVSEPGDSFHNHHLHSPGLTKTLETGSPWDAGFFQLWPWEWLLITLLLAIGYEGLMRLHGRLHQEENPVPWKQRLFFFSGLLILYVANGTPLHLLSMHYLFSAHMLQFGLLGLVMPPLLLLGMPQRLLKQLLQAPYVRRLLPLLVRPLPALLMFNIIFSIMHFPFYIDRMVNDMGLMYLGQLVIVLSALIMWWPMCCEPVEGKGLSFPMKMVYMVGAGLILTPSCAVLIFANQPVFQVYVDAPRYLMTALQDQQAGGIVMKLLSEFVYGTALAVVFYHWVRKEKNDENRQLAQVIVMPLHGDEKNRA